MKRHSETLLFTLGSILVAGGVLFARQLGDVPAIPVHMNEVDIESGRIPFDQVVRYGETLFTAVFNKLDGAGRPGTTADMKPRAPQPGMLRTTGPDSHSCASCHNRPQIGGGGDFATNVFVMADSTTQVKDSISSEFVNERMTVSLFGSGPIEMLAREMTRELQGTRLVSINHAYLCSCNVPAHLTAKGIDFGDIIAHGDGAVDTTGVRGVSGDLVVRPFHQNGAAVSLRQFTNEGMNQHLGLQSQELFGIDTDPDGDGVRNELTIGDITAIALFQAQLGTPGRRFSDDPVRRKGAEDGEGLFNKIGCTSCHIPEMKLKGRMFTEANPFNPEWKLLTTVAKPVGFDMTTTGQPPRLEPTPDGGAVVRAYTDLKRHYLCDDSDRFFCNEKVADSGVQPGWFVTRKLWDIGSSAAFGHRGDLSTITEAIEHHAGEARESRDNYVKLSQYQRGAIVEFLKTMQVLPAK
ncbi:MAG TPA: di-heme oxidoredictase family protein [Terriglobia bacterium]|jgi:cytochrome c peroxidase